MGRLEHQHGHHHQQQHRHQHRHEHQHELLVKLHVQQRQQPKLDQHVLELRVLLLGEMVRKQLVLLMVLVGSV